MKLIAKKYFFETKNYQQNYLMQILRIEICESSSLINLSFLNLGFRCDEAMRKIQIL